MNKIIALMIILLPMISIANNPSSSAESENTKISLYIPGFIMEMGSWFVGKDEDPEVKRALHKMRSISLVVREGSSFNEYRASGKFGKKMDRLKKQHFEELVTVKEECTHVSIQIRQNKKGTIRQVALLVNDKEETFLFARIRCDITMNDLNIWIRSETCTSITGKKIL